MGNIITKEWQIYKPEVEEAIKETIRRDTTDNEVLEVMLELLKSARLKNRTTGRP